ncbi:MAG TPA: hemolysin III family protein, partial [candidate division Zixibacteria bacterium]|nr:hemolysin III family protein [candidate division Zixibacteria bacterium]
MNEATATKIYPAAEERINVASHALGLGLSVIGLAFLIGRAGSYDSTLFMTSFVIFGCSLVTLYAASTCYHAATDPRLRGRLRIVDHSSIYILIAGTYTPFALITLNGTTGWVIFGTVWGMALTGIVLKLYYTGRYRMLSTLMYLFMGWLIIFALRP